MSGGKLPADFPVMSVRIDDAAHTPAVAFAYGIDFGCARADRARECGVRIRDSQNNADGATAEGFGAWIVVRGRFVADPEFRASDG